jgi:hypothetical protein
LQSFVSEPHTQVPDWQIEAAPHFVPHAPQFVGSMVVSVQRPSHDASPTRHPHVPPLHV